MYSNRTPNNMNNVQTRLHARTNIKMSNVWFAHRLCLVVMIEIAIFNKKKTFLQCFFIRLLLTCLSLVNRRSIEIQFLYRLTQWSLIFMCASKMSNWTIKPFSNTTFFASCLVVSLAHPSSNSICLHVNIWCFDWYFSTFTTKFCVFFLVFLNIKRIKR